MLLLLDTFDRVFHVFLIWMVCHPVLWSLWDLAATRSKALWSLSVPPLPPTHAAQSLGRVFASEPWWWKGSKVQPFFDCLTSCIFPNQDQSNLVSFRRRKQRTYFCALQHPEPDSLKVTAAANTGQRVSSEALKAWKIPSETLTLFGTWCQNIATSQPYHWHIITIVLTYSYLCILETSLGLITEALGYFGAAGRIYQSGRSKSFHSKYWTGHEVNSFVVEGFRQGATLTLNNYEWRTDLLDDLAGTSELARKQRSVIFLTYIFGEWLFEQKCKLCNHGSRCSTRLIFFRFRSFQINASTSNDISWYRPWYPMAGSALKAHLWIVEAGRIWDFRSWHHGFLVEE